MIQQKDKEAYYRDIMQYFVLVRMFLCIKIDQQVSQMSF